ncbi:MAG: hypothetical protein JSV42_02900 [Chloroflexota bacterium]|nr:MAG: hypothetical protein JSV42_02900 [Chloroflexota bacterium]
MTEFCFSVKFHGFCDSLKISIEFPNKYIHQVQTFVHTLNKTCDPVGNQTIKGSKMTISVHYDPNKNLVIGSVTEKIDSKVIDALAAELLNILGKHGCQGFLNDLRKAKLDLSLVELYLIPEMLNAVGFPQSLKRALIVSSDSPDLEDYAFFETTSVNRGHRVKIFIDQDEAMNWLRR